MTTLSSSVNATNRGCFYSAGPRVYYTDCFTAVQTWDGIDSQSRDAGITGPSGAIGSPSTAAGNTANGNHRIRYRYRDSKTGYVSNPSDELTVTVSGGNGQLTFDIGTSGTDIIRSTDAKVDTIDVEMTPVNGQIFYRAATALNSASSVVVSITDASLTQGINASSAYGLSENGDVFSHEKPPIAAIGVFYQGRIFLGGDLPYTITATFTNASTSVTGTGFSANWAGRVVRAGSDTVAYRIATATATTLTLEAAYGGSTGSKSAVVYSGTPNRIYYSRALMPESFYASRFARDVLQNRGDQLVAMFGRPDALYLFGRYSSERLLFTADPSATTSKLEPVQGNRGAFQQRVLVEAEGELFAWDRQGVYLTGPRPTHLSGAIDTFLTEEVDYSASAKFHASYDPVDRTLYFFYVRTGDSQPKYAACFDLDTKQWHVAKFLVGITASAVVPTSDGQVRMMLADENGYTWFMGVEGSFDGVPPANATVVTTTTGNTTTVVNVTGTTLDTTDGLAGAVLYHPTTGEARVIASNTASAITVASAFSNAPASSIEMYIGHIPFEWRSKWMVSKGLESQKRPLGLAISLFPGSATGKMRVYYYEDFSTTPVALSAVSGDSWADGVAITDGNSYVEIDLDAGSGDGFVMAPMPGSWKRALQVRITSERPDGDLRILSVQPMLLNEKNEWGPLP